MDENIFKKLRFLSKEDRLEDCLIHLEEKIELTQDEKETLRNLQTRFKRLQYKEIAGRARDIDRNEYSHWLNQFITLLEQRQTKGERSNINSIYIPNEYTEKSQCPNLTCKSYNTQSTYQEDKEIIQCFECEKTSERYVPPPFEFTEQEIEDNKKKGFSLEQFRLFNKNMLFSRHEIIRGAYASAFEYAHKAIHIGFDHQEAWEYYALCYYYDTDKDEVINNKGKEIIAALKTSKNERVTEKYETSETRKTIARNLNAAVDLRYEKIPKEDETARPDLITYLRVWYVCYEISEKKGYLHKALHELLEGVKLEWFQNDLKNGGIKTIDKALVLKFNAESFLKKVINAIGKTEESNKYIRQIELKAAETLSIKFYSIYTKTLLNNNIKNNYFKTNSDEEILTIINCIKKWINIYQINGNVEGIKLGLNELIGNKKIAWFELDEEGKVQLKTGVKHYDFNPYFYIKTFCKILNKKLSDQEKAIKINITSHLNEANKRLINYISFKKNITDEQKLSRVKTLLNNTRKSYLATANEKFVKDAILFFRDKKISRMFFKLEKAGINDKYGYDFSTIHEVKELCTSLKDTEWDEKTTLEQIKKNLIEDEFERVQMEYKKIITIIKHYDGKRTDEDFKAILQCILEAKELFSISGNDKHLIWGVRELAGKGESGIHWFWRLRNGDKMVNFRIRIIMNAENLHSLWDELVELIKTVKLYAPPVISKKATFWNQIKEFLNRRKKKKKRPF